MTNIMRYPETGKYGEKTGRQLIAKIDAELPSPSADATWTADSSFDLATELLDAPSFKSLVKSVLTTGHQIVDRVPSQGW